MSIFPGELVEVSEQIRNLYPSCKYDHRKFLPTLGRSFSDSIVVTEEYRIGYSCFKRSVASVLQPQTILEIGVGIGTAAMAFLDACPEACYLGYDNDCEYGVTFVVKPSEYVSSILKKAGYNGHVEIVDSQSLERFPCVDLLHVDGCHRYDQAYHDIKLAWESSSKWILIDDCRDSTVAAAAMAVLRQCHAGSTEWAYFEDTLTGNILIPREHARSY